MYAKTASTVPILLAAVALFFSVRGDSDPTYATPQFCAGVT